LEALKTLYFGHPPCFQFAEIESSFWRIGDVLTVIHSSDLRPQSRPTAGASQAAQFNLTSKKAFVGQVAQINLTSEEEALFF